MAQPTAYDKTTNFTEYAAANPSATYNAANIDTEYDNIEITLDEILTNLALIQRDDGALANDSVTLDTLNPAVVTFMNGSTSAWSLEGDWVTATAYSVYDVVVESNNTYVCATAHTSGTFATDLSSGYWILITSDDLADGSVTTAKIAADAVDGTKIADDSIDSEHYVNGSIDTAHIADSQITNAKMADDAIDLAEMAHQTLGQILTYGASGVPQMVAAGTTREVLRVPTTGTVPEFGGHGGDWGRVLAIANIGLSGAIASPLGDYPMYLIVFEALHCDTDNVEILATLSDDDQVSYYSNSYEYHVSRVKADSTSYAAAAGSSASNISLIAAQGNLSSETAEIVCFIHNPVGDGSRHINLSGWVSHRNNAGLVKGGPFVAGLDQVSDMTHIKFAPSSGNFDGGKVIVYGVGEGL